MSLQGCTPKEARQCARAFGRLTHCVGHLCIRVNHYPMNQVPSLAKYQDVLKAVDLEHRSPGSGLEVGLQSHVVYSARNVDVARLF